MKRILLALAAVVAVVGIGYVSASKWLIRHETFAWVDKSRDRPVTVDIAVRRDAEMKAMAGMRTLPVAVINHGNTVKNTEYSFLANVMAARGYLVVSIQHDLPSDPPLSQAGWPYVGRLPVYERGVQNIMFAVAELKKIEPNADYDDLTMIGHSNGGDISMFFAGQHPDMVAKVVTLDNLRVPFLMNSKAKILSFRSNDWKPDAGVVPSDELCKEAGIEVVRTDAQHTDMSDRGPEKVKEKIAALLDQFVDKVDSIKSKVKGESRDKGPAGTTEPRSMAGYTPVTP